MESTQPLGRGDRVAAIAAGLASFLLYLVTMAPCAFPGESSRMLSMAAGIDPFPLRSHILWNAMVRSLGHLDLGDLVIRVHLFSAVCGAVSVSLMYLLIARIVSIKGVWSRKQGQTAQQERQEDGAEPPKPPKRQRSKRFSRASLIRMSGAWAAALSLAVSVPFWQASNRAHFGAFDSVLLLVLCHLLISAFGTDRWRPALMLSFLYGIFMTESATLVLFAPAFGIGLLAAFLLNKQIRTPHFDMPAGRGRWDLRLPFLCTLLGILGSFPYFVKAWLMAGTPATSWMGFPSYGSCLVQLWREQYWIIKSMFPPASWLLLPLVTVTPLTLTIFTWTSDRPGRRLLTLVLYVGLLVFALGFVNDLPFSPGRLTGYAPLMVTPYVAHAAWTGFLVAALLRLLLYDISRWDFPFLHWRPASAMAGPVSMASAIAALGVVAAGVLASPARNWRTADGRPARFFDFLAERALADSAGRTWFIGGGGIDDLVVMRAAREGRPLRVLNLAYARSDPYLNYVSSLFSDPRYKGLATVGLDVLLPEWFAMDASAAAQVAVLHVPDLWRAAGLRAIPMRTFYAGSPMSADLPDKAGLVKAQDEWLTAMERRRAECEAFAEPWRAMALWYFGHAARLANDLGVAMEDAGDPKLARQLYERVIRFQPDHLSSRINLAYLARRQELPEATMLEDTARGLLEKAGGALPAEIYGRVRDPRVMLARGMQWAHAGRLSVAAADFASALELGGTNAATGRMMASLMASRGQNEASRTMLAELRAKDPDDPAVRLAQAIQLIHEGRLEEAIAGLEGLSGSEPVMRQVELLRASVELQKGKRADADKRLAELLRNDPQDGWAWLLKLFSSLQAGNARDTSIAATQLEKSPKRPEEAALLLAYVRMMDGDLLSARRELEGSVKRRPSLVPAWEMLIWIDYIERKRTEAEKHAFDLLRVDPGNAVANHFLGSFQLARKDYLQAEASLRASLARRRNPVVLNDLAWCLYMQGRASDALPLARESAEAQPESTAAVDTLAAVLAAVGDRDEALAVIDRMLEKQPDDPQLRERRKELEDQRSSGNR